MESLHQKSTLVANGHKTEYVLKWDTYSLVISQDSVRTALLYAALNDLYILSCNISNTYLEAPCVEKLCNVAGKESGSLAGTPIKNIRALYGLKSVGNSCHKALSTTSTSINFETSRADPDIWVMMSTNLSEEKYQIVLYVDNLLATSEDPKSIMNYFITYNLKDTVSTLD